MLVVSTAAPEPTWTPVMGAEVLFAPIDRVMLRRARRAALEALGREEDGRPERDAAEQLEELGDALSEALILAGARDWRGVVVIEDGAERPLPFDTDALRQALADPITFDAFDAAYVRPFAARERERGAPGNVSAASPSTTGPSETQEPTIAGFPAMASAAAVPSAHTASTSPRPKQKRRSGAS